MPKRMLSSRVFLFAALVFALCAGMQPAFSQTTISTGGIVGSVTDQSGAVVPGANVSIINKATGRQLNLTSNSAGLYNSGPLTPADYTVRVVAPGFAAAEINLTVQVDNTANGNVALQVGATTTTVEVQATGATVNTEQATVQGVITTQQIENLPINGRNFLQLAQLEPGVQIQDGAVFDPTKNGYSSISFGGRYGRTARIEVDGGDISDENVGTTTMNIPASAIQEFQIEQSSLDLSSGMTSSGAVNISTRTGSNAYHGEGFDYGRWHNTAARIAPEDLFFRREQFGANVAGPIKKDKVFFFLDWERTRQDYAAPVQLSGPFTPLSTSINQPFKEHDAFARMDWQATDNIKVFYRFDYNINSNVVPYISDTFQPFDNRDHAQDHLAGIDWTTGKFTHSFRFEFLRFSNAISDAVAGSGIFDPAPGIELAIGGDPFCLTGGADPFCSGPNFLAPQITQQHDHEYKYDGSTMWGKHLIRYGVEVNRILGGGFASFLALAPAVWDSYSGPVDKPGSDLYLAARGPFPGGLGNPLNYPVDAAFLGNGIGYDTALPQFGFPAGGQFDTRFSAYIGDNWKIRPNLNVSLGLHYIRDTGRSDSQLGPNSAINLFGAGLGDAVHQPNRNFAPQVGIAWDPRKDGKTVIRAGGGIYYENTVWNNVLFDAPARLQQGLFWSYQGTCGNFCGQPIGSVYPQIVAAQQAYQAATLAAGPSANGSYIGSTLQDGQGNGLDLFAPNFRTPYSIQLNVGIQHEFRPGTVLSIDYVRNRGLHYLVYYDTNHQGAARYLDKNAASSAINTTLGYCGVGSIGAAITNCPTDPLGPNDPNYSEYTPRPAAITDFASNGLDSAGSSFAYGIPNSGAAFPGANPNVGQNEMLFPIGHSTYNGMDVSFKQQVKNPMPGVRGVNLQVSYSLSRLDSMVTDQDFGGGLTDFDHYNNYFGPSALDRTNQFSFGGILNIVHGFQLSLIAHADSSLPQTLTVSPGPERVPGTAQIFQSDLTGDGTTGDVLPGTNIGSFGRSVNPSNINNYINSYNSKYAGQLTPAGQALVTAGLFSTLQLQQLGAVAPQLANAPAGQVGMGGLFFG